MQTRTVLEFYSVYNLYSICCYLQFLKLHFFITCRSLGVRDVRNKICLFLCCQMYRQVVLNITHGFPSSFPTNFPYFNWLKSHLLNWLGRFACVVCDCVLPIFLCQDFWRVLSRVALKVSCFCLKCICAGQSMKCKGCQEGSKDAFCDWSWAYKVGSLK